MDQGPEDWFVVVGTVGTVGTGWERNALGGGGRTPARNPGWEEVGVGGPTASAYRSARTLKEEATPIRHFLPIFPWFPAVTGGIPASLGEDNVIGLEMGGQAAIRSGAGFE